MSTVSWPKTLSILVLVIALGCVAGIFFLGNSVRPPVAQRVTQTIALPGAASGNGVSTGAALPDLPAPPPLPGAAQSQ